MILLPSPGPGYLGYFASVAFPSEAMVRRVIDALDPDRAQSTAALEPLVDLGRSRLEMVLKVLDVDGAGRVKGGWTGTGNRGVYDAERYRRLDEARRIEQQAMLDYETTDQCRMAFLRAHWTIPTLPTAPSAAVATTAPALRDRPAGQNPPRSIPPNSICSDRESN